MKFFIIACLIASSLFLIESKKRSSTRDPATAEFAKLTDVAQIKNRAEVNAVLDKTIEALRTPKKSACLFEIQNIKKYYKIRLDKIEKHPDREANAQSLRYTEILNAFKETQKTVAECRKAELDGKVKDFVAEFNKKHQADFLKYNKLDDPLDEKATLALVRQINKKISISAVDCANISEDGLKTLKDLYATKPTAEVALAAYRKIYQASFTCWRDFLAKSIKERRF